MCSRGLACSNAAEQRLKRAQRAYQDSSGPVEAEALRRAKNAFLLSPEGIRRASKANPILAEKLQAERNRRLSEARRLSQFHFNIEKVDQEWQGDTHLRPDLSNLLIAKAYAIACSAHAGVSRRSGEPYINHPLRVAQRLASNGHPVESVVAALLHDAVEDSSLLLADLTAMGFSDEVVEAIDSVTKREGEEYSEAVIRAARNPIGRWVKLADNMDNSSEEQLKPFSHEKRLKQKRKYTPAAALLKKVIKATTPASS